MICAYAHSNVIQGEINTHAQQLIDNMDITSKLWTDYTRWPRENDQNGH